MTQRLAELPRYSGKVRDVYDLGDRLLPIIPVSPVVFWGIAWLIDLAASPRGSWAVGAAHGVFASFLTVLPMRGWQCFRSLEDAAG